LKKKNNGLDNEGYPEDPLISEIRLDEGMEKTERNNTGIPKLKLKHNAFIIQKYIEQPLLLHKRKFDIRLWVLIDHSYNCYLFR
jgi:hypothetical protein